MTKNIAKSTKAKLLNIARRDNLDYQVLVIRYLYERLLYRLSISTYRDKFCLKGGALLYAFEKEFPRPTLDIDFLGMKIKNDEATIKNIFIEIFAIDYRGDGVKYEAATIKTEEITENRSYQGIRLTYTACLDTIRQTMKIDIGFGDVVTPTAQQLYYPVLIEELPIPDILAYSTRPILPVGFLDFQGSRINGAFTVELSGKQQKYSFFVFNQLQYFLPRFGDFVFLVHILRIIRHSISYPSDCQKRVNMPFLVFCVIG